MLPTSSISKLANDAFNKVDVQGCDPFSLSNNVNQPTKAYHSQHNSIKNQIITRTSSPIRNRSKSSTISDNTFRSIDFEDSVSTRASCETLSSSTINSSSSELNFMTSRTRSLSNNLDGRSFSSKNSLVITNSRLVSEMNHNQPLSVITFDDEIRVALPPNVTLEDVRECPARHVCYLLRITREKNIQLKKKRKRTRKPKDELPPQLSTIVVNSEIIQLNANGPISSDLTKVTPPPTDSSTTEVCVSLSSAKKTSNQFSPSDLLKLRNPNSLENTDLTQHLKNLKVYVDQTVLPPARLIQFPKNISIASNSKIKEYMSSSWHDLDDDIEEKTSREIYETLKKLADNFEEENLTKDNSTEGKSKKKNKKNAELNETKLNKSQNEAELNLPFEEYYTEAEVQKGLQEGIIFKQEIRINQKNYKEAYISMDDGLDIFIDGVHDRNRALDGDEVIIALHPKEKWKVHADKAVQKCGKVVFISRRNHPMTAVGYLKMTFKKNKVDKFKLIFSPRDCRIPRIKIPMNLCPPNMKKDAKQFENTLYEARIIKWDSVIFAEGILLQELGEQNDMETETKCILLENHLDVEHIENYQEYLPQVEQGITENELDCRLDLRTKCIFSIDPIGAKDLDDALSCVQLPNGNFEVGVHIADVSHYLLPDTPLDIDIRQKATSVYLVQKVFHMLPNELCQLCSLTPGADKLAFSLFVEFDQEAQIVDHQFFKTTIRSCSQFTYQNAQEIMDKEFDQLDPVNFPPIENDFTLDVCATVIGNLQFLAKKLRKRRFDEGALKIDQPKIVFGLDADKVPTSYSLFVAQESNWLIEEFMLVANILSANHIREKYPDLALLRLHSSPLEKSLATVIESLEKIGIYIDIFNAGSIHKSMIRYDGCDEIGIARMTVIINLLVKPMMKARYVCSSSEAEDTKYWHYALNVPFYTHFTSPIRRYADIVVHRLLASSLGYCELPRWTSDDVRSIAENCNRKKNESKRASEVSADLYLRLYLEKHGPIRARAVVIEVKERFFEVVDLSTRKPNRVYADKIKPAQVKFENNKGMNSLLVTWKGEDENDTLEQIIQMFTIINIQMAYNKLMNKITVTLLKPS